MYVVSEVRSCWLGVCTSIYSKHHLLAKLHFELNANMLTAPDEEDH